MTARTQGSANGTRYNDARVDQPTKGLVVELDYTANGLEYVSALDFIAGSERARMVRSSEVVPFRTVAIEFDGWVFARSGVAFVWPLMKQRTEGA